MGWPLMTNNLRKVGFPIGETIPKENTTGWIDHLMITSASENKELATAFLEYMIEANAQKLVADVTGYDPANPQSAQLMTRRTEEIPASRQRGRVHDAHLLLAAISPPRQIQRDLERSEGHAVNSNFCNGTGACPGLSISAPALLTGCSACGDLS